MIVIPRFRYLGNLVGCEVQIIENLLESSKDQRMRGKAAEVGDRSAFNRENTLVMGRKGIFDFGFWM
jgi:hypothetical protein